MKLIITEISDAVKKWCCPFTDICIQGVIIYDFLSVFAPTVFHLLARKRNLEKKIHLFNQILS
jgi:hypothetical protein